MQAKWMYVRFQWVWPGGFRDEDFKAKQTVSHFVVVVVAGQGSQHVVLGLCKDVCFICQVSLNLARQFQRRYLLKQVLTYSWHLCSGELTNRSGRMLPQTMFIWFENVSRFLLLKMYHSTLESWSNYCLHVYHWILQR